MNGEPIVLGHPEAHEKLTGKFFYKRTSEHGYNDVGNVKEFADATTRSLVTRQRAENGMRNVNDEQVDVNHQAWTFLCDERVPENEKLITLARQKSDIEQAANEGAGATIENAKAGRWYDIGAYNIVNVEVTSSMSGPQVEGDDYELDKENGRIRVISGGHIGDGETMQLTFDKPAITFEQYESQYNPLAYVDAILEEYNQFSRMFLRKHTFKGYVNIIEFPNQTGEFGVYRLKVTPSNRPITIKRPEAQTLPSHVESAEGPARSSSSSSSTSGNPSSSSSSS